MTPYRNLDLGATGILLKAGKTSIYGYFLYNNAATTRYVKIYNKATAPASTDTPLLTFALPAGNAANLWSSAECGLDFFPLGLGVRATTGVADADTAAPTANDVVVNFWYT